MSIDTDYEVLRRVLNDERLLPGMWAAEFGVYSGHSMGLIADHMPVIGFDSFEGLPEDWREGFSKGAFAYEPGQYIHAPENGMLVPGWFDDTVPEFPFPPLGLVHIDCDLYSSTVTALNGVADAIVPGTIVVFDEFHGYDGWQDHEAKAWNEFCENFGVDSLDIYSGEQEKAFIIEGLAR